MNNTPYSPEGSHVVTIDLVSSGNLPYYHVTCTCGELHFNTWLYDGAVFTAKQHVCDHEGRWPLDSEIEGA